MNEIEKEMVALANSNGGTIVLDFPIELKINTDPIIHFETKEINQYGFQKYIIEVKDGRCKPYFTSENDCWIKCDNEIRLATREELEQFFHSSKDFHPDEEPVNAGIEALDLAYFSKYYFMLKNQPMVDSGYTVEELLKRMGVTEGRHLNLAGLLFFGKEPVLIRPVFQVKAVAFYGNAIEDTSYRDSIDTVGNIESQYTMCLDFLKRNLRYIQKDKSFNSTGDLEVSQVALEEALMNALFHRDYTKASPIRLLVFEDRVELISPGSLPNHLTIENIQYGDTVIRNHRIVSFGTKILPFRGLGSGIRRILKEHPNTELINDIDGQQFKVIMRRASK